VLSGCPQTNIVGCDEGPPIGEDPVETWHIRERLRRYRRSAAWRNSGRPVSPRNNWTRHATCRSRDNNEPAGNGISTIGACGREENAAGARPRRNVRRQITWDV
jgi:hypothetical protein